MSNAAAISATGLTKHYGKVQALVDLDLDVRQGEVFGFLGPNGAGKTTAIRCLMDEIRPTSGSAMILGMDVHKDSVNIRHHLGYLPSDLAMYENLTGWDMFRYFANLRGGVDMDHVKQLVERLGAQPDKKVGNLSTGNLQKIGLVQAFMNKPAVVIMDEPSTGLDPLVQREFQAMLREMAAAGHTVFLSSHTLAEVQRVADRVAIIRGGVLQAVEPLEDLRAKAVRRVELAFEESVDQAFFEAIPGVRDVTVTAQRVDFAFEGSITELLQQVGARYEITDIATREADLEEIFLTYYRDAPVPS
ncbi:MAG: ATP-binding cassette domain-containing protein [Microthrixaceae bacterium]